MSATDALNVIGAAMDAKENGAGTYFLLYAVVIVLLLITIAASNAYRSAQKAQMKALSDRLDDCEQKHEEANSALAAEAVRRRRLEKKLAIVTGMLVATLGDKQLPAGFWSFMMDDSSDAPPDELTLHIPRG